MARLAMRPMALVASCLLLLLFLSSSSAALRVQNLHRTIHLNSHLIRQEWHIEAVNDGAEPVSVFSVLLSPNDAKHVAFIAGYTIGPDGGLSVLTQGAALDSNMKPSICPGQMCALIDFDMERPVAVGATATIKMNLVLPYLSRPLPEKVPQGTSHYYMLDLSATGYMPYPVDTQTLHVEVESGAVVSYDSADPTRQAPQRIQYGPYKAQPAHTLTPIQIYYKNNQPRLVVQSLTQRLYVSHYIGALVERHYDLANISPGPDKPFSRVDYGHSMYHQDKVYPLMMFRMVLPEQAHFISYRDEVGNISTSHYHVDSKSRVGLLDLTPRFPLFGGWQCSFDLSYNVPLDLFLKGEATTGNHGGSSHTLTLPMLDFFHDLEIAKYRLEIILPEGAHNIQPRSPIGGQETLTRTMSYLDTQGRPVYVFEAEHLVKEHMAEFELSYDYSVADMLFKPLLVCVVFFALFVALYVWKRLDFDAFPECERVPSKVQ